MEKNLKHGVKCVKRDEPIETFYFVNVYGFANKIMFKTKLEAINFISNCLSDGKQKENITLIKFQTLKF